MIANLWSFLQDADNRTVLGWLGGGSVVVVGACWAAFKFLFQKEAVKPPQAPTVSATCGSVAAGRDIRESKIDASRR
jgi:hypothetical protein